MRVLSPLDHVRMAKEKKAFSWYLANLISSIKKVSKVRLANYYAWEWNDDLVKPAQIYVGKKRKRYISYSSLNRSKGFNQTAIQKLSRRPARYHVWEWGKFCVNLSSKSTKRNCLPWILDIWIGTIETSSLATLSKLFFLNVWWDHNLKVSMSSWLILGTLSSQDGNAKEDFD